MAKRGGGGCTGAFEQIFRGAFVVSAVVGLLSIGVWATSCLDDFDPDPLGPGVYADVVTTNECPTTAGLTYTFTSSGDGPDPVGGFGITGNKLAPKSGAGDDTTTERLTIESSDGKAFVFHSAYFDLNPATFGTGFTISGKGPEPFTAFTGPPGTAGTYGPTTPKLVTSVEITSVDFFDDWIDDVTYENAVPGAGIYGAGNLIENGDPSTSTSDDTDFGSTPVGVPITKTFTIQSIGNLPLDLDGSPYVDFSSNPSGDFSVTAQPTVDPIAAGNSDTFTIQFNPSSADDKTAVVSISNNSEADDYTFTIGGEGTGAPEIGVTRGVTPIADGGTDAQGSKNAGTQVTLTYTVENTGNATLTVDPITSSGPSNVSVDSINPTVLSIAASNSDTFTVKYTPLAAGAFSFALEITNTYADENPYDITVSGTGVDVTKPDVTIEEAAGQSDPTNGTPINFDVVFTESVTGFETGDVTVGGTANPDTGTVTGSGTTYNVAVSGMTNDGTVTATIPADMAQDAASNANNASTSTDNSVTYDGTPPTDPTPSSASHTVSVWGNDNTVDIQIFGASDTGSGVDGFEIQWDKSASWTPTEAKEQEETWGGATFTATSDGDWYFHIATVDNV